MKAKVTISKEIDFDEIVIENYTLSEILLNDKKKSKI